MSASFQSRALHWAQFAFGRDNLKSKRRRAFRFLEEAIELAQACDLSRVEVKTIADYVYGRPTGSIGDEIGGTMLTLHILAASVDHNVKDWAELTLAGAWEGLEFIRAKDKNKPQISP
jgi:hypothetical protein